MCEVQANGPYSDANAIAAANEIIKKFKLPFSISPQSGKGDTLNVKADTSIATKALEFLNISADVDITVQVDKGGNPFKVLVTGSGGGSVSIGGIEIGTEARVNGDYFNVDIPGRVSGAYHKNSIVEDLGSGCIDFQRAA